MAFCQFSTNKKVKNFTEISNIFFSDYMKDAPDNFVKIYLYGLYLCQNPDMNNSLEQFTKYFNLSKEDIFGAFAYWQEVGLVKIIELEPFEIRYLDVVRSLEKEKQILNGKYKDFCRDIQEIISGRMLSMVEYQSYMEFLESTGMQPSALLSVANYCTTTQGKDIGYKYVLTVAKDWANKGILTQKEVIKHIDSINENNEILDNLLKIFGIKRCANIDEINTFNFITKELGYSIEVINQVARSIKNKSKNAMAQLENKMKKYYELKYYTIAEIQAYENTKEASFNSARAIIKELGLYYDNLEPVVDNYLIKWNNYGYDSETLVQIAKDCFKTGIKTLEGMDNKIQKFYKIGLISLDAINDYIKEVISIDNNIKAILEKLHLARQVNQSDRYMYNVWMNNYGTSAELLDYAIEKSIGTIQPMQYLNKILNYYNLRKINTIEEAKEADKLFDAPKKDGTIKETTIEKERKKLIYEHNYTKEELNSFFTNIDDIKL